MKYLKIQTEADAKMLADTMPAVISMDTEYVKGDPRFTKLLSVIISDGETAWSVQPELLKLLTRSLQARKLIFLQDYNHCDTIILYKHGCDLTEVPRFNLIDMLHLIDENLPGDLGSRVLSTYGDNYKETFWGKYKNFEDAPEDEALEYECKDGIYTYRLGMQDLAELERLGKLDLYEHVRALSNALLDTELQGLRVNTNLMRITKLEMKRQIDECLPKLRGEFASECETYELDKWLEEINKRSTERGRSAVPRPEFSFASDRQVSWLVYDALKSPVINKTKKRNPSTDFDTLQTLAESNGRLKPLVEYKRIKSVYSTFVEGMLDRVIDDRIYPNFNVSGTDTGRLSHTNPNMGNLPTEGIIRNFFIPNDGCVLIGADYAQLEVVIEANLTNDVQLLKIINEGASKHDITAQGLGIDRNNAKTLNFALQYGAGAGKVSKLLGISKAAGEDVFRRYWELYSGVRTLKEETTKILQAGGQVTNLAGRTRHFPMPKTEYEAAKQERQAYNFLIQGVAGDACNRAYTGMHEFLKQSQEGRTLFSVHDEILCEVREQASFMAMNTLVIIMEGVSNQFNFKYPLKAKAYGPLKFWQKT